MNTTVQTTLQNLTAHGMKACYAATAAEIPALVKAHLTPGCRVAVGGSVTLTQTGVLALLRSGDYDFLDRYDPALTREETNQILRQSAAADWFLCSANAITQSGELYNVDGNANRVAALAFGPQHVLVIAGVNKIVPTLSDAVLRVKTVAAPKNARRLHCETPCAVTGRCLSLDTGRGMEMTAGCQCPDRLCCQYLVSGPQRRPDRIRVILCGEPLGY